MTRNFCDRCHAEIEGYPDTTLAIQWGFFRKMRNYALCKKCDQELYNLVVRFLDAD